MKSIMIIEDDSTLQGALIEILTSEGYEVNGCSSGVEAFEMLKEIRMPDIILTDLVMPIMDGFAIIEELKKNVQFQSIPVVVLSNLGEDANKERATNLGAYDYLVKSNCSLKEITDRVKEILVETNKAPVQ